MSRTNQQNSFKKKRSERIQVIVILLIVALCLFGCATVGTEKEASVTLSNSETELQGQDSEEVTEEQTEEVIEEVTEAVTEEVNEAVTEVVAEEATDVMKEMATEETTQMPTEEATEEVIQEVVESQDPVQTNTYILNTNTKKFHIPGCKSVNKMKDSNKAEYTGTRDDVIAQGYLPCGNCHP